MKKDDYEDLIEEMSEQLAQKILETEDGLENRALQIDGDIARKLQSVGQKTSKKVLEKVRDNLVEKKSPKD